ncbi:TfoX family protein [Pseudomethylobacillus aquaticus]|uniref:TfoX family protein n=1 Tax=Pseudomethylobacillus aquaticus TaxID=2676064 RepID=A0A3N0V3V7_9PROT|nr:TfoX/Sxy family protein [Pseudomethylobacillus aquaticus]ROH87254.1 TfoX family protein [Pseudomethylobacillus aquaticus]
MSEFVDYLHEVFVRFGPVEARKMFGGYGLYHQGVMFALVVDEQLYLKTDAGSAGLFAAQHLAPFSYRRGDKTIKMSYHLAPEQIYDDAELAAVWARRAFAVALHSKRRNTAHKTGNTETTS